MEKKWIKILVIIFPVLFGLAMYCLNTYYRTVYETIGREDHLIEWMQFFFFLSSAILSITIAIKMGKVSKPLQVIFILLALGLFFVAFEEISWGERVFNIEAPEVFDEGALPLLGENVQSEMNLHNFSFFHTKVGLIYILIATYAIFSSLLTSLFYKFKKNVKKETKFLLSFLTPPAYLALYFSPLYINFFNWETFGIRPQDYEMTEFLFSLGLLIFLSICLKRINLHLGKKVKG